MLYRSLNNRLNCQRNKVLLLNLVRMYPGISRSNIAQILNLSPTAITTAVDELQKQGLVTEQGVSQSNRGRKPIRLEIQKGRHFFLTIDIGAENLRVAVMDFNADVLEMEKTHTHDYRDHHDQLEAVFQMADQVIRRTGLDWSRIEAVGCGVSGFVNPRQGMVHYCPNIPGWNNVPLASLIEERLGKPCYLEDSTPMKTLAEKYYGKARGVANFLFLGMGVGIGAGIVINGWLYRGAGGGAGEIGHIPIPANNRQCKCGNIGCLETIAAVPQIVESVTRALAMGVQSSLQTVFMENPSGVTIQEITRAANEGDRLASNTIREAGEHIGSALAVCVNMFNPELIVLSGPAFRIGNLFLNPILQAIKHQSLPQHAKAVRVEVSELDDDKVTLIGSLVLISERHWGPDMEVTSRAVLSGRK